MRVLRNDNSLPFFVCDIFFIWDRKYWASDCLLFSPFLAYFRHCHSFCGFSFINKVLNHTNRNQKKQCQYSNYGDTKSDRISYPTRKIYIIHSDFFMRIIIGGDCYRAVRETVFDFFSRDTVFLSEPEFVLLRDILFFFLEEALAMIISAMICESNVQFF